MLPAARFLSYALHPLLMPALTLWLTLELDLHLSYFLPAESRWKLLGIVALMTIVFPLSSAMLLRSAGVVQSLEMHTRQERIAPFVMTLLYYIMAAYLLTRAPVHPLTLSLFAGAALALLLVTLITLRWKISAHMVGIGGCIGALIALDILHHIGAFVPLCLLLVLAGALGTARLIASDHTPAQVYTGALLGFASVLGALLWMPALPF
ncbi:MAG: hypothetical protein WAT74_16385 [Flavobacteriales bacterium]